MLQHRADNVRKQTQAQIWRRNMYPYQSATSSSHVAYSFNSLSFLLFLGEQRRLLSIVLCYSVDMISFSLFARPLFVLACSSAVYYVTREPAADTNPLLRMNAVCLVVWGVVQLSSFSTVVCVAVCTMFTKQQPPTTLFCNNLVSLRCAAPRFTVSTRLHIYEINRIWLQSSL